MSMSLQLSAEYTKLARVLGVSEAELSSKLKLTDIPALRALRNGISTSLFDGDVALFKKLAASTKLTPAALTAVISEKAMGPVLCARVAGLLEAEKAVDISRRLSVPFLTDVSTQIDPRSAGPLLNLMPNDINVAVAIEMVKRKEFIAMARFVDTLNDAAIQAISAKLGDEDILRIGAYVEDGQRLNELIRKLGEARARGTLKAAKAKPAELWPFALMIWQAVKPDTRAWLGQLLAEDDSAVDSLVNTVKTMPEVESLRPLLKDMHPCLQALFA